MPQKLKGKVKFRKLLEAFFEMKKYNGWNGDGGSRDNLST